MAYSEEIGKKNHDTNKLTEAEPLTWMFWKKRRYIVALMVFFGLLNAYMLFNTLGVAIIEMTQIHTIIHSDGTVSYEQEFPWSSDLKGLVLSASFIGIILTPIFGGYLACRYGGHRVFRNSILLMAILNIISPISVAYNLELFLVIRCFKGACMGLTFPALQDMWTYWAPPAERSRIITMALSGFYIGPLIGMPCAGLLAATYGWRSCFYLFGMIAIIWYGIFLIIVKDSPQDDPRCSEDERLYIQLSLAMKSSSVVKHPWFAIFTSVPVLALVVATFSYNWGVLTISVQYPTFIADTMNTETSKAGSFAAIPSLIFAVLLGPVSLLADWLPAHGYLTCLSMRKLLSAGSQIVQGVILTLAGYANVQIWLIVCITLSGGLGALTIVGLGPNSLELAKQHAAIISGLQCMTIGVSGFLTSYLTGVLVQTYPETGWGIAFCICGVGHLLGAIIFVIFGSTELQEWAKVPCEKNDNKISLQNKARVGNFY